MNFSQFFAAATGHPPYDYQCRLACGPNARAGNPETLETACACESKLIHIPTGLGKTAAVVLAWLWNRLSDRPTDTHASHPRWPRRLVYCLPMRTLVEQTAHEVEKWLQNVRNAALRGELELSEHAWLELLWLSGTEGMAASSVSNLRSAISEIPSELEKPHSPVILMGGEENDAQKAGWDIYPEKPCILIGTQDMLLSRALNRGYGMSRYRWPMHFGLLNNDALWVMDETQLMGVGVETSAQLDAFRARFDTFSICATWWMSATLDSARLATVDHPQPPEGWPSVRLQKVDLSRNDVQARVRAKKSLGQCKIVLSTATRANYAKQLAEWVSSQHRPGSFTLVVVNNVARAQELYSQLKRVKLADPIGLIHSRFRAGDRKAQEKLLDALGGRIVIATQAVEAGVDISARTLITELAPWSSLVQRFGRCNRHGEFKGHEARVFWINIVNKDAKDPLALPYADQELALARKTLKGLQDVGPESLTKVEVEGSAIIRPVIRRKDVVELFDTTPELAGHDLDISRYIRDGNDTDVQVFWRDLGGSSPIAVEPEPTREELCRVSLPRFREFLDNLDKTENKAGASKLRAYVWNQLNAKWDVTTTARAGVTYMLDVQAGGYSTELGWFGAAKFDPNVCALPQLKPAGAAGYSNDQLSFQRAWVKLSDHTHHVVDAIRRLVPQVAAEYAGTLEVAGRWHDVGKTHAAFQKMLTQGDSQRATVQWAKSANAAGRCERRFFRHELASALAWLQAGPTDAPERDLIAYLIAAHHGKVRLSIRSLPGEEPPPEKPHGRIARGILEGDAIGPVTFDGFSIPAISLDLSLMEMGQNANGNLSWLGRMLALRDRFGPFRLAYLESLLRAADIRASADESKTSCSA